MQKVKIYERTIYDHFAIISRDGKIVSIERKARLTTLKRRIGELLDYCEGLNSRMAGPFYEVWQARDVGGCYDYTGFHYGNGKWEREIGGQPNAVESAVLGMAKAKYA